MYYIQFFAVVTLLAFEQTAYAQQKGIDTRFQRTFQVSLFPGISTNGLESGSYFNRYSLNIFGGLSAGNRVFELGLVSNANVRSSTGIQLAGLANIVGANAFLNVTVSDQRKQQQEGLELNFTGVQLSGILNYVRQHSKGIQLTGGFNINEGDFSGFRVAGVGNTSQGSSRGIHLAGVYNIANGAVTGWQISGLMNSAGKSLSGFQLALINRAVRMPGKQTTPPTRARSLQIGLINFSREMDGTQIGLINFGGKIRGKQIGLINFFNKRPSKEHVRNGTPIGLLNFGSAGSYFRVSINEVFLTNIEYTTGNCLNCSWTMTGMPVLENGNKIYNQNALILGYNPPSETWGFGYGFQKVLYNKVSVKENAANERRMITYGIRALHINRSLEYDKSFNILTRLHVEYGRRIAGLYVFAGVALNYFVHETVVDSDDYRIQGKTVSLGEWGTNEQLGWLGYSAGIQL